MNAPRALQAFYRICLIILGGALSASSWASTPLPELNATGQGYVDSITFDGKRVSASGWAASDSSNAPITTIRIFLAGNTVYDGGFESTPRPDVASSKQRPDWQNSGWKIAFELPDDIKAGDYAVTASVHTADAGSITLTSTQTLSITDAQKNQKDLIRIITVVMAGAALFLAVCFMKATALTTWINRSVVWRVSEPVFFSLCVVLVALLFVGMGLTGSSLPLGQKHAPFVQMNSTNILGHDQPIRSDEWLVLTPFAIAQYNHEPRFPVVNTHVGEDGQNMLVTSMTSVPVAHVTALAKPATWGFFVFDLRHALAWDWWFPLVGCFLALAFVLNRLSDDHWKHGFLFSALFCCSPYVVGWSFWPAYTVFFPCVILLCALQVLKTSSLYRLLALGTVMGLAIAGFFFILYPAWQVSVGYVFIALTVGLVIRDKLYHRLNLPRLMAYALALGVAGLLLAAWWWDAREAIHAMAQTLYPGQRLAVGGTTTLPMLLRGFTNMATLQQLNSPLSNQSLVSSFYYLLLPLAALVTVRALQNRISALEWALTAACIFLLYYMFVGLPVELARYSLWGRSAPLRADLALGLASLILMRLLLPKSGPPEEATSTTKTIAFIASIAWVYIIYRSLSQLDDSLTSGMPSSLLILILLITAALGYYLITQALKPFIAISLGLSLATTASFHPVNSAPSAVSLLAQSTTSDTLARALNGKRVVVLGSQVPALFLIASGVSVVNGTHYFPQKTLWARLDPKGTQHDVYNRYQHLMFVSAQPPAENYQLSTPRSDVVTVTLNLETFDFRLSGAHVVLAPDSHLDGLNKNGSLVFSGSASGWSWFDVLDN